MPRARLSPAVVVRDFRCARCITGLLLLFLIPALPAIELTQATAIDKAGRQRMLTQRIVKTYIQIGLGASVEASRRQLLESVYLFDTQLEELRRFAPDGDAAAALQQVGQLWQPFRELAVASPTRRDTAEELNRRDEALLESCERVVRLLRVGADNSARARRVDSSGRQRMLSQRLAKLYMLQAAGLGGPGTVEEMTRLRGEFEQALAGLSSDPGNTPAIREKLAEVRAQWVWFESALDLQVDNWYPLIVADASEKILQLMESITAMYAGSGER